MPLPKTNTYHKLTAGRTAGTEVEHTPHSLWEKAIEYFAWVETNPLKEEKAFSSGKRINLNKIREMNVAGFCVFAHISRGTYDKYSQQKDYQNVAAQINDVLYAQKFEAAAAGLLETSFVARKMGLKEHTTITPNGKELNIEVADNTTLNQIDSLRKKLE